MTKITQAGLVLLGVLIALSTMLITDLLDVVTIPMPILKLWLGFGLALTVVVLLKTVGSLDGKFDMVLLIVLGFIAPISLILMFLGMCIAYRNHMKYQAATRRYNETHDRTR